MLAACGLNREARALAAPGVLTVVGGADAPVLRRRLEQAWREGEDAGLVSVGLVSVGLGGALSPDLCVGDWVAADRVLYDGEAWPTDPVWRERLQAGLARVARVVVGAIVGGEAMVVRAADKAALHARTGGLAVDMESQAAARFAAERGLPFTALRVISDTAGRDLPRAVLAGMKPDGGMDLAGVLGALARDPRQLPALIRTGREAGVAFRALRLLGGDHLLCGPGIGCPYLGQLLLDVT